MLRVVLVAMLLTAGIEVAKAADPVEFKIGYLRTAKPRTAISLVDVPPENNGLAGAQAATADNNTTGQFLGQRFSLEDVKLKDGDNPAAAVAAMADRGISVVLADLPADALLQAADAGRARGLLFFNVGAIDERLRENDCRGNVIHIAPSRSMLADALAQYLVWKQWRRWLLVSVPTRNQLYGDALRRAAKRFGARIVEERVFEDTGGSRRSDTGIVQIQRQMPVFTQRPRPTMCWSRRTRARFSRPICRIEPGIPGRSPGSAGLMPTSWHASNDQWGARRCRTASASISAGE